MRSEETVLCEIKRHPIGLIGMYVAAGLMVGIVGVLVFMLLPQLLTGYSASRVNGIATLVLLLASALMLLFVIIANIVYWGNRWIVTSDSVTQILQHSLFDKQSSQLSMGNLEDVSVEQRGILTHIFNYGVIKAETAGERSKFSFMYCPNPNYYAQQILKAREAFEQGKDHSE